ncbi:MAG TPA: hypothetical protein VL181_08765 [Holophagaceae bacterium]|nr:hypothetical protein [Holophagaceae bacterium]
MQPPALQDTKSPAAQAMPLAQAETAFLNDLDAGLAFTPPKGLADEDQAAFRWLRDAAQWQRGAQAPAARFPKGGAADREAQAWRSFLAGGGGDPARLPLHLSGSRLLLWEWMRDRDRHRPLPAAERRALEDRLLDGGPPAIKGWALRHALCFAVAGRDTARFSALKARHGESAPDTFTSVQALFGLLDGPSPIFRLWQLPGLAYRDVALKDLGPRRVWICPPGPPVPEGAAWIIPSQTGDQNDREVALSSEMKTEAEALSAAAGRPAWFAASRSAWEASGLQWFPILIELDKDGNLASVRMGDAAP